MTPPIIVGVEPYHHDPDAPVLAALLARATGAPVVAVAAYGDSASDPEPRGAALARLAAVEPAFHGLAMETAAGPSPSAPRVLHDYAEECGAGLLVVGSTHRGLAGRITLGSTADRLLHGTTCPIAVGFAERMRGMTTSAPPSSTARKVTRRCGLPPRSPRLATPSCAPSPRSSRSPGAPRASRSPMTSALTSTNSASGPRRRCALRSTAWCLPCPPTPRCSSTARSRRSSSSATNVDLLVCGSRGYGRLRSVLLDGVSRWLVHIAACAVIVVPRGTERMVEQLAGARTRIEAGRG